MRGMTVSLIIAFILILCFSGAAMAMSSVTVVTNANRLRLWKPGKG